ncbi:hypothetical protein PQX77_000400 [Marasmius sp. AFHP31]|nr:hypothetical protein PQX77_000400 [Marasmius sp. AFHP31]
MEAALTAVGQEELRFLSIKRILWSPGGQNDKLYGKHDWGFTFTPPPQVTVGQATFRLPPNFSDKTLSSSYIDYRLVATVKRGTFKTNLTISQGFVYEPFSTPPQPSPRRQLAYRNGHDPPSPAEDPDGWKVLPPHHIKGRLGNGSVAEIRCILAIAVPVGPRAPDAVRDFSDRTKLCYAVKSTIPLALMMTCGNEQALSLLSNPSAARVALLKHIITGTGDKKNNVVGVVVGRATFWPSDKDNRLGLRTLEGGLEIPAGLKPSFEFAKLAVQYTLDWQSFDVRGLVTSDTQREITIVSERITLTTMQAPTSTSRSRTPRSTR